MTAHIGRLAGAILAECDGSFFLIGNTKEPCDWEKNGFKTPVEIDAKKTPVLMLEKLIPEIVVASPRLSVQLSADQTGEDVARTLAERFLIVRNASVSDRLWTLIVGESGDVETEATWLLNMPEHIWQIVRDTVLRCV